MRRHTASLEVNDIPDANFVKKARTSSRKVRVIKTMSTEVSTKTSIWPSKIHGSDRSEISIFVVHQLGERITLDLGIRAKVVMLNKPVSHLGVIPGFNTTTI